MEACASSHYWGRELSRIGHEVRLIPPVYVKPFVKRQKNDAADAEAICEASQRPTMRFVQIKSEAAQAAAVVFRARDLLVSQRTQIINARGCALEPSLAATPSRATILRHQGRTILISGAATSLDIVPSSGGASFKVEGRAGSADHRSQLCSLRVTQRIFERGQNRPNGVDAFLQGYQLPLLGVEAAQRCEIALRWTCPH
jgi:transposase